MPDNIDYERLGWLIAHPEDWSADDLATSETLVADQKKAIGEDHSKDVRGRDAKQDLVDQLEAAIGTHRARQLAAFKPGERVVFEDGTPGAVHRSREGYSHVYWDDDQPREDFGGSVVPNAKLRREQR